MQLITIVYFRDYTYCSHVSMQKSPKFKIGYLFMQLHAFFYKKLVNKKRLLGWSKNQETFVLCSRKTKKLCNINLSKIEYIGMLPLVNLYDFAWKRL